MRTAKPGEKLTTLDGKERTLDPEDLLICDAQRAQALAGVMGGGESEVSEGTTRVLLESAWFLPATVRRSSKRHGLHTEASHRFERGADPEVVPVVLDRAARLIAELAGGTVLPGRVDVYPRPFVRREVVLRQAAGDEGPRPGRAPGRVPAHPLHPGLRAGARGRRRRRCGASPPGGWTWSARRISSRRSPASTATTGSPPSCPAGWARSPPNRRGSRPSAGCGRRSPGRGWTRW